MECAIRLTVGGALQMQVLLLVLLLIAICYDLQTVTLYTGTSLIVSC